MLNAPLPEIMSFCRWQLLNIEAQGYEKKRAVLLIAADMIPLLSFIQKFCHTDFLWNALKEHTIALESL